MIPFFFLFLFIVGQHVKLNSKKLRAQSLEPPTSSVLVTCIKPDSDELIGHAFATVWNYDGGIVGWITQLVVHTSHRRLNIATHLLQTLKPHPLFQTITAIGLATSHPASIAALAKYNDITTKVHQINTSFIASTAPKILASTPINYLKDIKPLGSLFDETATNGVISAVDTQFFVDHKEPLEVLQAFKDKQGGGWCLGELLEGYEFLIVIPVLSS